MSKEKKSVEPTDQKIPTIYINPEAFETDDPQQIEALQDAVIEAATIAYAQAYPEEVTRKRR